MVLRVRSLEEAEVHVAALQDQIVGLGRRVSDLEAEMDMAYRTPFWKRLWFAVNGWPLRRVVEQDEQAWRPWHRWAGRP